MVSNGCFQAMNNSNHKTTDSSAEADLGGHEKQQAASLRTASAELEESTASQNVRQPTIWRRIYDTLTWTPPNCRWNPEDPPKFSTGLNVLFAFAGTVTVANLYYNHPILNVLAENFGVDYSEVSQIPTLGQAGYAVGLFFLCPLGDLLRRRPFVLSLVFFTATMWSFDPYISIADLC